MRIMVVDDDPDICNLLWMILSAKGHQVDTYTDPTTTPMVKGQAGLTSHEASCVDAILVDYCMPHMNGLDFLKLVSERHSGARKCNKAMITAFGTTELCKELDQMGIKYFRKPFKLPEINKWLEECSLSTAAVE